MNRNNIIKAKQILMENGVIGFPTESVYGLAGNAYSPLAVKTIFRIKNRPLTSPLIVHTNSLSRVEGMVKHFPLQARKLAKAFWPGPLTLLLDKKEVIPEVVTAGRSTVGIRIPNHSMALTLLKALPFPLAAPSANPFGYISPTTAAHVVEQLGDKVPYILDGGPCQRGLESTIIGFADDSPMIYRLGSITQEALSQVMGYPIPYIRPDEKHKGPHLAPGRTKHHYAPRTPLYRGDAATFFAQYKGDKKDVVALCFDKVLADLPLSQQIILSPKGSIEKAGQRLFAAMHILDKRKAKFILAPLFPDQGIGRVMNERLSRAHNVIY